MKNKTATDETKALGESLRVLAIQGAEVDAIGQRVQKLKRTIFETTTYKKPDHRAPPSQLDQQAPATKEAYQNRVRAWEQTKSLLELQLRDAETELKKLEPLVSAARRTAAEIRESMETERRERLAVAVRAATEAAASRAAYLSAVAALRKVRAKVSEAETSLLRHSQLSQPSPTSELERRIDELIATGEFPDRSQSRDPQAVISSLQADLREAKLAATKQQQVVDAAHRRFCGEVCQNVGGELADIVGRMASGLTQARNGLNELIALRQAFNSATENGGSYLPPLITIQPLFQYDSLEMQLNAWRQLGYSV